MRKKQIWSFFVVRKLTKTKGKNYQISYTINRTFNKSNYARMEVNVKIDFNRKDSLLVIQIDEEIDHHAVETIRRRADYEIQRYIPKRVVLDFDHVSFMDSSGIGMIVGRYKLISMLGGKLVMRNVKENLQKILDMSGVTKIIPLEQSKVN